MANHSSSGVQLSLFNMDIKQVASLDDFESNSFLPIKRATDGLINRTINELYIYGNNGSGKTHLLNAIYQAYIKHNPNAIFLSFEELLDSDTQALQGLEAFSLIIIDDLHLIAQHTDWQQAVFHLINEVRSINGQLIISTNSSVVQLPFEFMDLTTRLAQMLSFNMPDGTNIDDRRAFVRSILRQKGWLFDETIVEYLIQEGPQQPKDMVAVLTHISSYFTHRNHSKIPKKLLDEVKKAIIEQSFLLELAEFEYTPDLHEDNLNLPI